MLVSKGRIQPAKRFDLWIRRIASPGIVVTLPFDIDIICALHELPKSFHGDPADCLIVARPARMICRSRHTIRESAMPALSSYGGRKARPT